MVAEVKNSEAQQVEAGLLVESESPQPSSFLERLIEAQDLKPASPRALDALRFGFPCRVEDI